MPTEKKIKRVEALEDKLKRCTIAISTEIRGVSVAQLAELRRKLRERGVECVVVKNTLASIAGEKAGKPGVRQILKGPSAMLFGYGEVTEPAKAIAEHIRATRITVTVTGAVTDGRVLAAAEVQGLATVPPKPVLIGQLLGNLIAPLSGLVYALTYHMGGLARVLEERRKQLEKAATPAAEQAPGAAPAEAGGVPSAS